LHRCTQKVTFGDCDPAGIVFYPNTFRWMDAAFHDFLRTRGGGHDQICRDLGAIGIGLAKVSASFHAPMRDGDVLDLHVSVGTPGQTSVELTYNGFVGERLAFKGNETRALFINTERGISAGDIGPLLGILTDLGTLAGRSLSGDEL